MIEVLAREFGVVHVILQFREVERCDLRCQQANPKTFYDCTCSCLAANHGGVGQGAAWLQVGETTLINTQIRESRYFDLAGRMPARFRAMVLLAAFASLRWGEVSALRRCDIAEDASWVRIPRAFVESTEKGLIVGPPKSKAAARTLTLPTAVRPDILRHLETYTQGPRDALVFTGENGGALRRPNFNQRVKWTAAVTKMGLKGLHFHDLRHAGNTWAAQAGTSTRDLMTRMGHDDMRAALIYQHASADADRAIASRLSDLAEKHRRNEISLR